MRLVGRWTQPGTDATHMNGSQVDTQNQDGDVLHRELHVPRICFLDEPGHKITLGESRMGTPESE